MIRALRGDDVDTVMKIWLDGSVSAHSFIDPNYWRSQSECIRNVYLPAPNSKTVVYEQEAVKGFMSIVDDNYIGALFVDINSQGQGIGKRLIEYAQSQYSVLTLAVFLENKNAFNFYLNRGFKVVEEVEKDFPGHKEAHMKWEK